MIIGMFGETKLIDYGIHNEQSHIRAHVCPKARRIYVYPTQRGVEAILTGEFIKVNGFQDGVSDPTSEGFLVPPFSIRECISICVNNNVWDYFDFSDADDTTVKGNKAEKMIFGMIKRGLFPIPALCEIVNDKDIQISGGDIFIKPNAIRKNEIIIQVKCDFPGGERSLGGSGNLFIQIAESNPLHKH